MVKNVTRDRDVHFLGADSRHLSEELNGVIRLPEIDREGRLVALRSQEALWTREALIERLAPLQTS